MKIWFDTEFIEDGKTIDLLSIGMIREDGATYYAENREADLNKADDWVRANVFPHMTFRDSIDRGRIAAQIIDFAGDKPEFWAYYADYDWVVLCQLYGRMIDLPQGWPMFCRDTQQLLLATKSQRVPATEGNAHNALDDAIWCKAMWESLSEGE